MNTPPPLVIFETKEKYLSALDTSIRDSFGDEINRLIAAKLPPIVSARALAVLFGFHPQYIGYMCQRPRKFYRSFRLRKGKNLWRSIDAPRVAIKVIQKWVGHYLARGVDLPSNVVGFTPNRSTYDGAKIHCGADWVFSTDLIDFFKSTSASGVIRSLKEIGYSEHGASLITNLSSLEGGLAQGSPASPVLSNIAFKPFDGQLIQYCTGSALNYSRYADDIVISGKGRVPSGLSKIVANVIEKGGWEISTKKTRIDRSPNRLKVYGLLVNGENPRLTKGYRKRIRAIKHLLSHGKVTGDEKACAIGHLAYARSIESRSV